MGVVIVNIAEYVYLVLKEPGVLDGNSAWKEDDGRDEDAREAFEAVFFVRIHI